jgi:hypothetical protein
VIGSEQLLSGKPGGQRQYFKGILPLKLKTQKGPKALDVTVRRGVTLRGKVVGPDGKKVAHAALFAPGELIHRETNYLLPFPPGSNQAQWLPVKDGQFELPGCDPGKTYRFFVLNGKSGQNAYVAPPMLAPGASFRFAGGFGSEQSALFRDGKDRFGAVADITPPKDPKKTVTIKLARCGSAEVRFVDAKGKPAPQQAYLELEVTPQQGKGKAALNAENMTLAVFWPMGTPPTPDAKGRLTIPALIPRATYHFRVMSLIEPMAAKTFKVEAGKKAKLGDLVVK